MKIPWPAFGSRSMKNPMLLRSGSHHQPVSGLMLPPEEITALPSSEIACGLPDPVEVTVIVPLATPATTGVNFTWKEQVAPLGMVAMQELLLMVSAALSLAPYELRPARPEAVTVIVWGARVVATGWFR